MSSILNLLCLSLRLFFNDLNGKIIIILFRKLFKLMIISENKSRYGVALCGILLIIKKRALSGQNHCCGIVADAIINVRAVSNLNSVDDEHRHSGERGTKDILAFLGKPRMPFLFKAVKNVRGLIKSYVCHDD